MLVTLAVAGLCTGLMAGSIGIGGGIILMPAMLAAGMPLAQAVTVSLFIQSVPQTLPALLMSATRPFPWAPAITIALTSMLGGIAGAWGVRRFNVHETMLKKAISAALVLIGVFLWCRPA